MMSRIQRISRDFFESVAEQFPVAAASDEFFYFPQVMMKTPDWSRWDRFSADAVDTFTRKLAGFEHALAKINPDRGDDPRSSLQDRIDLTLLRGSITTLREQLLEVRCWEKHPTFHLTIACLGMAEAVQAEDIGAAVSRAETLPDFIDNAMLSLKDMPALFRDLGLLMLGRTRHYLISLVGRLPVLEKAFPKLDALEAFLRTAKVRPDFRMPVDLTEKVIRRHLNCRFKIPDILTRLNQEIRDMRRLLAQEARAVDKNVSWEKQMEAIPLPTLPAGGLVALYRNQVQELAEHCLSIGILSKSMSAACPVQVLAVPSFLSTIRTASSYSIRPDHPPSGGVFYIINADQPEEACKGYQREYKILAAHETYPGHHFLDLARLRHARPIRRCIERPLFYEGWACFAETLLLLSGYLVGAHERMLLARRRLWRAVRGKIDLGLQTGSLTFEKAVDHLMETGIRRHDAAAAVRKYPLNPGYQLCYTLGFKGFSDLFQAYGRQDIPAFVNQALSNGEIDFSDLERMFRLNVKITRNDLVIPQ